MNVRLRDVTVEDLDTLFAHQTDPVAIAMASPIRRTREQFLEHWTKNVIGNALNRKRAVVVDDQLAGFVASFSAEGKRLIAYFLGREFWGRGIATLAVREFLREETSRPLHATVAVKNAGSIRVLQKSGFQRVSDEPTTAPDGVVEYLYVLI